MEETQLDSKPPSAAAGSLTMEPGEMGPANGSPTSNGHGALLLTTANGYGPATEDGGSGDGAKAPPAVTQLVGPDGWTLVFDGQDPAGAIRVDAEQLDFGSCSRLSASEYRSVTVTNTTAAKLTAFVVVPEWQDPGAPPGEAPKPAFQVSGTAPSCIPVNTHHHHHTSPVPPSTPYVYPSQA